MKQTGAKNPSTVRLINLHVNKTEVICIFTLVTPFRLFICLSESIILHVEYNITYRVYKYSYSNYTVEA